MAQGNKPVIYYHLTLGGTRFIYGPPTYHGEIGVQNCHCGKTYPDHVTIHVVEGGDHLLGEIEAYHQEIGVLRNRNIELQQANTMLQPEIQQETNLLYKDLVGDNFGRIDGEGDESNPEEQILAQEVEQVQGLPIGGMNGMMKEFEEDPEEDLEKELEEILEGMLWRNLSLVMESWWWTRW
ncbi:hypothetical protein ACH5RR_034669 [Cinchona calisaya]|uniref:Uncharacterized protein n=1 Tax=Cinchona calisaya TaxID=153742 RepID=A0ABD2YH07_9GENT